MKFDDSRALRAEIYRAGYSALYSIPPLYLFFARMKYRSKLERIVHADTEIAIGGFPRSANTFATHAFRSAQNRPVNLAHHVHSAGQIHAAMYYHIPAIVLIRHPKDAIVSLALRNPGLSIYPAFNNYYLFYSTLLGRPGYVIAKFEQVISDFGSVITRVNERFGTSFLPFFSTEENKRKVFDMIEKRHLEITRSESVNELMVSRPSEAKKDAKVKIEQMLEKEYAPELKKVISLWKDFCAQN